MTTANTHIVTINLEVSTETSPAGLHEHLCKAIHEQDTNSWRALTNRVVNVELVGDHKWSESEVIAYSFLAFCQGGADVTIQVYMKEFPESTKMTAYDLARNYLTWAQGDLWMFAPLALEFLNQD